MPYNTSAIPPSEEVTGHSALPRELFANFTSFLFVAHQRTVVSRVKKIIRLDDDVNGCSNNAAFLVTIAAVNISPPILYFYP